MNKLEFICRQLSRAEKKTFEHYVITRIWHLLNDTDLKFITQQYVVRSEGRALTDMYFPQLQKHIEIDEGHHKMQIQYDKIREADIINATGHKIWRVDVTQSLEVINSSINDIVSKLKVAKNDKVDFKPWDFEAEQNPSTYISRGYIDLKDDVAFRTMVDAANCFGNTYKSKGIRTGGAKHPKESGKFIWFPKLYKNGKWDNAISDDENTITEMCLDEKIAHPHIKKAIKDSNVKRIVFARVKSPLGDIMYRFKGEYELDLERTNSINGTVLKRTNERVKTYSST
jgi:very-short-patch-repair endonuclease